MTTATPTDLTINAARVQDISATSQLGIKALSKKVGITPGELKAALEHGATNGIAIKILEFEDTLPKANVLDGSGQPVPADGAAAKEEPPTTRDRKPAKRAPRAASAATAPEGEAVPPAAPVPAEVIPSAPPAEGSRAHYALLIREGGTFNERAEGLKKGDDWVEAYVPIPIDLHARCQAAAKAMGVSLKQFRTYAFLRLVAEVENG